MFDQAPQDVLIQVNNWIRSQKLLTGISRVLVAVSGGADSTALLTILDDLIQSKAYAGKLVCVHFDHQLRGTAAAQADQTHVTNLSRTRGWPCFTTKLPVRNYAQAHKLSLETAAHKLRRTQLIAIAREQDCQAIATGHHLDDNAETLVFRLSRGTGLPGLAGIRPRKSITPNLSLIRPLLCLTRDNIRAYLAAHGLSWIEDQSNRDLAFRRNFIRHQLLPALEQTSDQPLNHRLADLARSSLSLQQRVELFVAQQWDQWVQVKKDGLCLDRSLFSEQVPLIQVAVLQRALTVVGGGLRNIDRTHLQKLMDLARANTGQHILPLGLVALSQAKGLRLTWPSPPSPSPAPPSVTLTLPGTTHWGYRQITATWIRGNVANLTSSSPWVEHLDADCLRGSLTVRKRRPGDRFHALGASGSRKVGTFLTDNKIPPTERGEITIIEDAEKIVWVAPIRLSEAVKVRTGTKRILQLRLEIGL